MLNVTQRNVQLAWQSVVLENVAPGGCVIVIPEKWFTICVAVWGLGGRGCTPSMQGLVSGPDRTGAPVCVQTVWITGIKQNPGVQATSCVRVCVWVGVSAAGDATSAVIAPPYSITVTTNVWAVYCNR